MAEAEILSGDDPVLEDLIATTKAVADRLRVQILRLLNEESYAVSELCFILEVGQPALSHHLKVLTLAGLVSRRREGNSIFYRRAATTTDPQCHTLCQVLFDALDETRLNTKTSERVNQVHEQRRQQSLDFFASNAEALANQRTLISDVDVYAPTILELIDRHAESRAGPTREALTNGAALEIGPGDGTILKALAERYTSATGIDHSAAMIDETRRRTVGSPENIKLLHRDFASLPARHRYRVIVAAMVVHHMASPQQFFLKARQVIKAGGLLVVAELERHDQRWACDACGDLWLGFDATELQSWAERAGFRPVESQFLAQKNGFQIQIHGYASAS